MIENNRIPDTNLPLPVQGMELNRIYLFAHVLPIPGMKHKRKENEGTQEKCMTGRKK